MTEQIKAAFDGIQAEASLKEKTLQGLREKMQTGSRPRRHGNVRRLAAAACLVLVLFSAGFFYSLYFTETAHIDLDINPSLELTINRFERVIGVEAYNADAEALLQDLTIRHKSVEAAMDELIAAAAQTGALGRQGLVSVTVQSLSGDEAQLLKRLETGVSASVSHHGNAVVDVFSVDSATRNTARELHISPAKYLAILELQEVDPTATLEECQNHSIGEIRQRTQAHGGGGHGGNHGGTTAGEYESSTSSSPFNGGGEHRGNHGSTAAGESESSSVPGPSNGQHGGNRGSTATGEYESPAASSPSNGGGEHGGNRGSTAAGEYESSTSSSPSNGGGEHGGNHGEYASSSVPGSSNGGGHHGERSHGSR